MNAVATVTAKLHQRESELEMLNELLLEVTREYDVERTARIALEKTHVALVKTVEGERETYRASMLRGKVETLTRQLKVPPTARPLSLPPLHHAPPPPPRLRRWTPR